MLYISKSNPRPPTATAESVLDYSPRGGRSKVQGGGIGTESACSSHNRVTKVEVTASGIGVKIARLPAAPVGLVVGTALMPVPGSHSPVDLWLGRLCPRKIRATAECPAGAGADIPSSPLAPANGRRTIPASAERMLSAGRIRRSKPSWSAVRIIESVGRSCVSKELVL